MGTGGVAAMTRMKRGEALCLVLMNGLSWGTMAFMVNARGADLAYGIWAATLIAAVWIIRPTAWQLRHPRRAWWMAHKGRKLVAQWEAEQAAEARKAEEARRHTEYAESLRRDAEERAKRPPPLYESGYDERGSWLRIGSIPFSAERFAPPPLTPHPPKTWHGLYSRETIVRVHVARNGRDPCMDWMGNWVR
jgi:hypothetical protein